MRYSNHVRAANGFYGWFGWLQTNSSKSPAFCKCGLTGAPDIVKFGDKPFAGDGFKAWYILQHYRNAKPFVTEVKISYPISISFK